MADLHVAAATREHTAPDLPPDIAARFHVMELLGETALTETFLLREKTGGAPFVLKKPHTDLAIINEAALLSALSHPGLPRFEAVGDANYTLRPFIPGTTLDKLTAPVNVTALISQLCDILTYLHTHGIIHRDIKPTNVIFCEETDRVTLIDFGTSRVYNANATVDTVVMLTEKFAPPEQYGFAQTDARSDIFSLGMLIKSLPSADGNRHLQRVANKCTALEPNRRYQSAAAVKKALTPRKNKAALWAAGIIAAIATALFLSQPDTNEPPAEPYAPPVYTAYVPLPEAYADIFLPLPEEPRPFIVPASEFEYIAHTRGWHSDLFRAGGGVGFTFVPERGLRMHDRLEGFYSLDFQIGAFPPGLYTLVVEFASDSPDAQFSVSYVVAAQFWHTVPIEGNTLVHDVEIVEYNGRYRAVTQHPTGELIHARYLRLNNTGSLDDFYVLAVRLYPREGTPHPTPRENPRAEAPYSMHAYAPTVTAAWQEIAIDASNFNFLLDPYNGTTRILLTPPFRASELSVCEYNQISVSLSVTFRETPAHVRGGLHTSGIDAIGDRGHWEPRIFAEQPLQAGETATFALRGNMNTHYLAYLYLAIFTNHIPPNPNHPRAGWTVESATLFMLVED